MKNILKIIVLAIIVSFLLIACDMDSKDSKPTSPFKGTWKSSEGYITIWDDSSWHVVQYTGGVGLKGTYTYKDNTATVVFTEITDDGVNWRPILFSETAKYTNTATVSGNKLTWGITTYTRQ